MRSNQAEDLSRLIAEANAISDETKARFSDFTAQQLNCRPDADQWSVAQCFDHLVRANEAYFPIFDEVISGEKKSTFWERVPWLPSFWGKVLIKSLDPKSTRKLKAPKIFRPSSSQIDGPIISRFIDQQNRLIRYMKSTEHLDLERIKISSPVTSLITYSLLDTYRIIVTHEKRHFLQAKRVSDVNALSK